MAFCMVLNALPEEVPRFALLPVLTLTNHVVAWAHSAIPSNEAVAASVRASLRAGSRRLAPGRRRNLMILPWLVRQRPSWGLIVLERDYGNVGEAGGAIEARPGGS